LRTSTTIDRLGGDPSQLGEVELVDVLVVLGGHLTALAVDGDDEVLTQSQTLAHTSCQGLLQGAEHDLSGDVLGRVDEIDHPQ